MFERDKNHPSILLWSLGNESGEQRASDSRRKYEQNRHAGSQGSLFDTADQKSLAGTLLFMQAMVLPTFPWLGTCEQETAAAQ